jgi:hypothetical protein
MYLAKSAWSWQQSTDAQNSARQTVDCCFAIEAPSTPARDSTAGGAVQSRFQPFWGLHNVVLRTRKDRPVF